MMKSFLHMAAHRVGFSAAHTQTTQAERDCVAKHAADAMTAVELGVYEGATTRVIREAMRPDGVLYAVDPFFPGRIGICWGKMIAKKEIGKSAKGRVVFIEKLSFDAAGDVPEPIDFLFIDADHSWEGIRNDWETWSPLIREGGGVLLHDTRVPDHHPGVADFGSHQYFEQVIRHDGRFDLVEQVDSLSVMRRR